MPQVELRDLSGGVIWAISNAFVLPLVKLLGLGLGFALYHAVNLVTGYLVGRFGLFGTEPDLGRIPWVRDLGCGLLIVSFVILIYVEPESPSAGDAEEAMAPNGHGEAHRSPQSSCTPASFLVDGVGASAVGGSRAVQPSSKLMGYGVRLLGMLLGLAAGGLSGVNAIPFDRWSARHPDKPRGSFVFVQALGAWMGSTAVYLGYATARWAVGWSSPPHSRIRPAIIGGVIWSFGFVFMCLAIDGLGFTAGYAYDAVGPVFVASLVSVFWFKELKGRRTLQLFVTCCLFQAGGVGLICLGSK